MVEADRESGLVAPTRQIVLAFLLSKGATVVLGSVLVARHQEYEASIRMLVHLLSTISFVLLFMLATGSSLAVVIRGTRVRHKPAAGGRLAVFLLLAVAVGVLMRLGSGGAILAVLRIFDGNLAERELAELATIQADPSSGLTVLLALGALAGAVDEEIVYRRLLQWHFCARYGVLAGVLVAGAIFAIPHANPAVMISGVCLSLLYLTTGMLWVPIVAHITSNLIYPMLASLHVAPGPDAYEAVNIAGALVLCVLIPVAFRAVRKPDRQFYEQLPGSADVHQAAAPK